MKKDILHGVNPGRTFLLAPLVLFGLASAQMASTAPAASYSVVYLGGDAVGNAIERNGDGNPSATHVFRKPGTYQVTLQVTTRPGAARR